jgi:sulfoxide reductase catalytic subunit YedY
MQGHTPEFLSSEITPKEKFLNRRNLIFGGLAAAGLAYEGYKRLPPIGMPNVAYASSRLDGQPGPFSLNNATVTPKQKAITYNNFYEFGTDKRDPSLNAHTLQTRPWSVSLEGLCANPKTVDIDSLMHYRPLQDRTYRFRCVEAWSMIVPWVGYPLSELINFAKPLPSAKFVEFISFFDHKEMPEAPSSINWPYKEGLRMDEAMHPLTLLTFGSYGDTLENQEGAPVRVIVPWKYGFKSAKSLVKIRFVADQPETTWNDLASDEYGFYSNVNPQHDHPRWSQAHERFIGASTFPQTIPTLPFNGYADQVASLYKGMDLNKYF